MRKFILLFTMALMLSIVSYSQNKGSFYIGFDPQDTTFFNVGGVGLLSATVYEVWVQDLKFYRVSATGVEIYFNQWIRSWTDTSSNWQSYPLSEINIKLSSFSEMIDKDETILDGSGQPIPTNMNLWRMLVGLDDAVSVRDSIVKCVVYKYGLEQ